MVFAYLPIPIKFKKSASRSMYTPITLLNNRSVCLQEDSKLSRGEVLVDFITVENVHVCLGNRGFTITGVLKNNGQGQA